MTKQEFNESLKKGCREIRNCLFWFVFSVFYLLAFAALYNLVRS